MRMRVYLTGVASTSVVVDVDPADVEDATDLDQLRRKAVELAHEESRAGLCHQCARHMEAPGEWHAGSWTQDPEDLDGMVVEV